MKAKLSTDGGARGNPGPAAFAYVLEADDGTVLAAHGETIGVATNNVAEYRGLIAPDDHDPARHRHGHSERCRQEAGWRRFHHNGTEHGLTGLAADGALAGGHGAKLGRRSISVAAMLVA